MSLPPDKRPSHWLASGDWCRGLVIAAREGAISREAANVGLRLAVAINWNPSTRNRPGLYWSIAKATKAVGVSPSGWKRARVELVREGFLADLDGHYVPMIEPRFHSTLTGERL